MNKLLFTVSAIAALSLLLVPGSSIAEPTHANEIGLYTETWDGYGPTGTYEIGSSVEVYLVLTKPEGNNGPWSGLKGFECRLNFDPFNSVVMTADFLNGNGLNMGDVGSLYSEGYLEYVVEFATEVPAVDEAVLLIYFLFFHLVDDVVNVTLGPVSYAIPSIPGHMVFVTPDATLEVMYSMGGSHDAPVFIFGGEAVAVENESFGSVKALYR